MPLLFQFLLRATLAAAGLVLALSLALVLGFVLLGWLLRSAWARLTGRPVAPLAFRMGPRGVFEEVLRRGARPAAASRTPRADAAGGRGTGRLADVTDVQPK
jgi:hypothetical protein